VRGKGTKLGEHCPKVRLSQDRMLIEPLTLSGYFFLGGGIFTFGTQDFYVRDYYVREKFVAPFFSISGLL